MINISEGEVMYALGFFQQQTYDAYIVAPSGDSKGMEKIHLTRQGIANNDFAHTHKFKGLLEKNTIIDTGDLVIIGNDFDKYLVMAVRKTYHANQANLWYCDCTCDIYRIKNKYAGNQISGKQQTLIADGIACIQKDTNGRMKTFDAGLLESTIKLVYMPTVPEVSLADRLVINGKNYQIDSIDDSSVKNVLTLQLSEDKRKL